MSKVLAAATVRKTLAWYKHRHCVFFGLILLLAIPRTTGKVVINEILLHPGTAATGPWVELHNSDDTAISLKGWNMHMGSIPSSTLDVSYHFPSTVSIPAGGYLTVGKSNASGLVDLGWHDFPTFPSAIAAAAAAAGGATQHDYSFVHLTNGQSHVDALQWSFKSNNKRPSLTFPSLPGVSLSRTSANLPSQDAGNWCPSAYASNEHSDQGTSSPGHANSYTCPPTPQHKTKVRGSQTSIHAPNTMLNPSAKVSRSRLPKSSALGISNAIPRTTVGSKRSAATRQLRGRLGTRETGSVRERYIPPCLKTQRCITKPSSSAL